MTISSCSEGKQCHLQRTPEAPSTPVSAVTRGLRAPPDAATAGSYPPELHLHPGPDGAGAPPARSRWVAQGNVADLPAQRVGATCTVTEDARDARDSKQPGNLRRRKRQLEGTRLPSRWSPTRATRAESSPPAVALTNGNAGGVSPSPCPTPTQGAVHRVVNSVVPHAGIDKTFTKVAKSN